MGTTWLLKEGIFYEEGGKEICSRKEMDSKSPGVGRKNLCGEIYMSTLMFNLGFYMNPKKVKKSL